MKLIINTPFKACSKKMLLLAIFCSFGIVSQAQTADQEVVAPQDSTVNAESANGFDSKTVKVAYGEQRQLGQTAAISTVSGDELRETLTPSLSNTLYGRLPGLTVMQGSGEPGYDEPQMFIRGKGTYNDNGYLVLVDGFEASFDQLSVDEIESVTILKDAAALALYGVRGANGAILVTTRRGHSGETRITASARTGWQQPTRLPEFLGAYDYSRLYNEALANDGLPLRYTEEDLESYQSGSDPFLYPDVNWYDEVLRESAPISDYSLTFSGGGETAKYFVLLGHMRNQGLYKNTDPDRKINSNADFKRYNFRSNIDVQLSKAVRGSLDFGGRIEDRSFPNYNGPALWENMARFPANAYPVKNPDGSWGGNSVYPDNPVASVLDRGFASSHDRNLMATIRLSEDLDFITEGLRFSQALSANNWHRGNYNKTKTFSYKELVRGLTDDGRDTLMYVERGTDSEFTVDESGNNQYNRLNFQLALDYERQFNDHGVAAMLMYHQDSYHVSGNNVPYANQGLMGRINYNYKSKYFAEFGFSYNGSERFPKGNRFGFFPALSGAWIISSEDFLQGNEVISFLKARASVGLVGSDRLIGNRFAYTQDYYYSGGYNFGQNIIWNGAIVEGTIGNPNISWEKALKYNIGFDGIILDKLSFTADFFFEKRTDVLASANATIPSYLGVNAPYENVGQVNNRGFEIELTYENNVGELNYFISASTFYAKNKIVEMNEVVRAEPYLYRTGNPVGQPFGLEYAGFYQEDDFDVNGNLVEGVPVSTFSPVQPGDLKYVDQNNDGLINENDEIAIGNPFEPALTYTANIGAEFKGFDIELFFHGAANRDVMLSGSYFWAFVDDNNAGSNILNRWTPENPVNATYPRLTTQPNENNYRASTFWQRSGDVLRLRNIEVGYSLPEKLISKLHITKARIFVSGVNLFTWDEIETVDPEHMGGYPTLKSYSLGARLQF